MKLSKLLGVLAVMAFCFTLVAFVPQKQKPAEWKVPAKYQKMTNSFADDASLVKVGKMLFSKHCKSCHGAKGLGDGPKAKQLETDCSDFSSVEFQAQKDGELYYKSFVGRDEMPNFEKKITEDEDRWAVINFMRTMGK
ncbi:MAG: cytochrome c [Bacteroidales bacterium]|nr:cytochrome c [Bacteroidales bacterium]